MIVVSYAQQLNYNQFWAEARIPAETEFYTITWTRRNLENSVFEKSSKIT